MRTRRLALALIVVALLVASLTAGVAVAGAPPVPVSSKSVPVSGAVVTKVSVRAAVSKNKLIVSLVPGRIPARKAVSLKGKVSDRSALAIKANPEEG